MKPVNNLCYAYVKLAPVATNALTTISLLSERKVLCVAFNELPLDIQSAYPKCDSTVHHIAPSKDMGFYASGASPPIYAFKLT